MDSGLARLRVILKPMSRYRLANFTSDGSSRCFFLGNNAGLCARNACQVPAGAGGDHNLM